MNEPERDLPKTFLAPPGSLWITLARSPVLSGSNCLSLTLKGSLWPSLALTVSLAPINWHLLGSLSCCCVRELDQPLVVVMHLGAFLPIIGWFQNIQFHSKLYCCQTIKYNSVLVPKFEIRYFLSQNAKILHLLSQNVKTHAVSQKKLKLH